MRRLFLLLLCVLGLAGCAETSRLPAGVDIGPDPVLPEPTRTLIPTVMVAPAKGWPEGFVWRVSELR